MIGNNPATNAKKSPPSSLSGRHLRLAPVCVDDQARSKLVGGDVLIRVNLDQSWAASGGTEVGVVSVKILKTRIYDSGAAPQLVDPDWRFNFNPDQRSS